MAMMTNSFFVTFEGGEGAGKSTLMDKITRKLTEEGFDVVQTREPGGSKLGESIRHWLLTLGSAITIGNKAELLLFLSARAQHIEELIQPALSAGKIVLCDRFNDSTIVYQGLARGLGVEYVKELCHLVCGDIEPSLTLFLDVDPVVGLQRTKKSHKDNAVSGEVDRIEAEKIDFHQRVRAGFQELARQQPQRIQTLDANLDKQTVFDQAYQIIHSQIMLQR